MGNYVDANLGRTETVLYRGTVHWAVAGWFFFLGAITAVAGVGVLLIGIGFLYLYLLRNSAEIAVTNRRVIFKVGILGTRSVELNLNKLESLNVEQGIFGKVFGYGTVVLVGTGGSRERFNFITNPLSLRRAVNDALEGDTHRQLPESLAAR
jgi:uncharacterized membrane protein YdbT with pleckstrin-like domain